MTTLKDVAQLAGVSPITVSRVVNTPEAVKPKTRQRVEEAMKTLSYMPNSAAKNLASNRTGVIDVYIPQSIDLSNPFVMHLIAGISEVLSNHMYSMLILRDRARERMCDGYIVTGLLKDEIHDFVDYASQRSRPVMLFGHTQLPDVTCVDVDNVVGASMGVEHLLKLGHRRIAMLNVQENKDYVQDRQLGYQLAMEKYSLSINPQDVFFAENSVEGGAKAVRSIANLQRYSAIFCATDTIAIGAVTELNRLGVSVPDQMSIVGFDGLGHHLLSPVSITTVRQPVIEVGKMLASALMTRLNGEAPQVQSLIAPVFVPGESAIPYSG